MLGGTGILLAAVGRVIESDALIVVGIPGGLALLLNGVILRTNYRGVRDDYDEWIRSRGDTQDRGARLGSAFIFAGVVFTLSAVVGLIIY